MSEKPRSSAIALQLYTVRALAARDLLTTLDRVADLGYAGVELAGLHGAAPVAVREHADTLGLTLVAAHVGLERFEREPDAVAAELGALGVTTIVFPSTPRTPDPASLHAAVARLTAAAQEAHSRELRPLLHNHAWELAGDGCRSWQAISSIPQLELELDLGWAWVAGEQPAELLAAHAGRVPLVHVKDHVREADAVPDRPIGDGEVDYARILPVARAAGVEWFVVEQDEPGDDPLEACARSLRALRALLQDR